MFLEVYFLFFNDRRGELPMCAEPLEGKEGWRWELCAG
jgi:hypothetical protein